MTVVKTQGRSTRTDTWEFLLSDGTVGSLLELADELREAFVPKEAAVSIYGTGWVSTQDHPTNLTVSITRTRDEAEAERDDRERAGAH